MKISTRGRYALRIILDIAMHQDHGFAAMKDIARRQQISKKYGDQIGMQLLLHQFNREFRCGMRNRYRQGTKPQEYWTYFKVE